MIVLKVFILVEIVISMYIFSFVKGISSTVFDHILDLLWFICDRNLSTGPPGAVCIIKKFNNKIINNVGKINKNLLKK